jgi:hypothetical protein
MYSGGEANEISGDHKLSTLIEEYKRENETCAKKITRLQEKLTKSTQQNQAKLVKGKGSSGYSSKTLNSYLSKTKAIQQEHIRHQQHNQPPRHQ